MKLRITLLIFALVSFTSASEDLYSLFSAYKVKFNKVYESLEVEAKRFEAFCSNYAFIREWNTQGHSAVLGLTKFSDLTTEEFSALHTGLANIPDPEDIPEFITVSDDGDIPSSWDWREHNIVTNIKNQEDCGSCWSFGTTASVEGLYALNGNPLTSFSEGQLVDCMELANGCDGGFPAEAMEYIKNNGQETLADYPYVPKREKCNYNKSLAVDTGVTGAGYVTPKSKDDLYSRAYIQPTVICVAASNKIFQNYVSGVIGAGCGVEIDHIIAVVGYTPDYFIVKNSWGTDWGLDGYLYLNSSTGINDGFGACAVYALPQFPLGLVNQTKIDA